MKWFRNTHEIIELAKENAELKRGIGDIFLTIIEGKKGKEHICLKNDNSEIGFIIRTLSTTDLTNIDYKK